MHRNKVLYILRLTRTEYERVTSLLYRGTVYTELAYASVSKVSYVCA